ncbi:cytochrome c oxidase subunit II [Alkalilimnicola sp. S0819]|uniref:cytochrome c oxidase subunit II n=1 Tax=Alkalilimnicola sp. S0819 TaxID=2613922 RepID=UPI0012628A20|nr:cytochrome c oxidase subunit II [Alkalilimnicola sp. S0819]KAB7624433.1 cytochrome c oxidase subunit II [Alkalilimnicola sp. S0819]MPQ16266.1 cytochrome c oxidase subunit II [Alkalilimnicola sp. S0819]
MNFNKRLSAIGALFALLLAAGPAAADFSLLNMTQGATDISRQVYGLHMTIMWICIIIGIVVFGAIFWSVIHHRKSKGVKPAQFHHSTTVEIVWTVIPMLILIFMAVPATKVLVDMEDSTEADMTVKVTGYQWKWHYDYLDEDIAFFSNLDQQSRIARLRNPAVAPGDVENYLLEVDRPLVVPVGQKIRFLLTSNDVIHAWWVPDLGWKKDAIPGFINEAWARINEPGIYRGQCAELCGRDHGFMPVVVHALSQEDYAAWVAEQSGDAAASAKPEEVVVQAAAQPGQQPAAAQADPQAASAELSRDELMAQGEQVYQANCQSCHGAAGEGMGSVFPALAGGAITTGPVDGHIDIVLNGSARNPAMAAFGAMLSDEQIAAVVTYERNAFGNDTGDLVQPADVQAAR